jgi:hypothetical protein
MQQISIYLHKWFSKNFISLWKSGCYTPLASCPSQSPGHHRVHAKSKPPPLSPPPHLDELHPCHLPYFDWTTPHLPPSTPALQGVTATVEGHQRPSPPSKRCHPTRFCRSPMTCRYGEPPPSYSFPACHTIDAHPHATGVGEPPHPSHRRPPCRRTCSLLRRPVWATQANLAAAPGRTLASLGQFWPVTVPHLKFLFQIKMFKKCI